MYLVDTNVLSEARRRSLQAVRWLRSVSPDTLYISVVSLGEIARGIAAKQKKDRLAADHLMQWLTTLRQDFGNRIENVDDAIAIEWGRQATLRSRGVADGLIAATATVRGLVLVTRNVADFSDLPLTVLNPWDATSA